MIHDGAVEHSVTGSVSSQRVLAMPRCALCVQLSAYPVPARFWWQRFLACCSTPSCCAKPFYVLIVDLSVPPGACDESEADQRIRMATERTAVQCRGAGKLTAESRQALYGHPRVSSLRCAFCDSLTCCLGLPLLRQVRHLITASVTAAMRS